jgi:hypothetical protein
MSLSVRLCCPTSENSVKKLSKKSPSGVSSVEIAGIPQRNKPSVPTSWASNAFVTELARLFRQFQELAPIGGQLFAHGISQRD